MSNQSTQTSVEGQSLRSTCHLCRGVFFKRQASAKGVYCSRQCQWNAKRKYHRPSSICQVCGCEFVRRGRNAGVFCSRDCKGVFQSVKDLMDREWLEDQYIRLDRSSAEIASEVGCDRKTVDNWLRKHGISMRPRGSHKNCRRITKGTPSPWAGHKHTLETRRLLSEQAKTDGRMPYKPENGTPFKGKRGSEVPSWKGGVTPERQAFYSSDEWKKVARVVWKRDGRCCQRCGRTKIPGDGVSFDIHHVVSFAYRPLRAESSNLVLLCEPCHYWVHGTKNPDKAFIKEIPTDEVTV